MKINSLSLTHPPPPTPPTPCAQPFVRKALVVQASFGGSFLDLGSGGFCSSCYHAWPRALARKDSWSAAWLGQQSAPPRPSSDVFSLTLPLCPTF